MYTSEIKEQLLEASDVLTNFLNNENNLKAIQNAAELIAESLKSAPKNDSSNLCLFQEDEKKHRK